MYVWRDSKVDCVISNIVKTDAQVMVNAIQIFNVNVMMDGSLKIVVLHHVPMIVPVMVDVLIISATVTMVL